MNQIYTKINKIINRHSFFKTFLASIISLFLISYLFKLDFTTNSNLLFFSIGSILSSFFYHILIQNLKKDFSIKLKEEQKKSSILDKNIKLLDKNISSLNKTISENSKIKIDTLKQHNSDKLRQTDLSIISSTQSDTSYVFQNNFDPSRSFTLFKDSKQVKKMQSNLKEQGLELHFLKFHDKNPPQKNIPNNISIHTGHQSLEFPSNFISYN